MHTTLRHDIVNEMEVGNGENIIPKINSETPSNPDDNNTKLKVESTDFDGYKLLTPPLIPPIIKTEIEPTSNSDALCTRISSAKKQYKFSGSHTITPGERLYRQGIELLEKKKRERKENLEIPREILNKLEKMVHRRKIPEFNQKYLEKKRRKNYRT